MTTGNSQEEVRGEHTRAEAHDRAELRKKALLIPPEPHCVYQSSCPVVIEALNKQLDQVLALCEQYYHPSIEAQELQVEIAKKHEGERIQADLEPLMAEALDISDWSLVQQYVRGLGKLN